MWIMGNMLDAGSASSIDWCFAEVWASPIALPIASMDIPRDPSRWVAATIPGAPIRPRLLTHNHPEDMEDMVDMEDTEDTGDTGDEENKEREETEQIAEIVEFVRQGCGKSLEAEETKRQAQTRQNLF